MADCPKCHFTQPDDQYCANCGVDMKAYKPEPDPLIKRFMQNLGAQISLVILIVAMLFSGIYITQKEVIDRNLRKALTSKSSDDLISEAQAVKDEVALDQEEEPQALSLSAVTEAEESSTPEPTITNTPFTELEVAFAEVPMPLIQIWADEGQILSEGAQTRSIMVTQESALTNLRRQDWEPYFLPGGQNLSLSTNTPNPMEFLQELPTYESAIGMALQVRVTQAAQDNSKINFEIESLVNIPSEMDQSVDSSVITGTYEIPRGGVLVVVGLIPQSSIRGEAAESLSNTPLSVMQSPEFLAGATEFALIIRPQ